MQPLNEINVKRHFSRDWLICHFTEEQYFKMYHEFLSSFHINTGIIDDCDIHTRSCKVHKLQSEKPHFPGTHYELSTSTALNYPWLHSECYSIKAIMLTMWLMQTRTSSHKEDNIARHLIYHRRSRRLHPHALFVLSMFLYIFRVKVTHCQSAVCPALPSLYICHTLHPKPLAHIPNKFLVCTGDKKRKNSSDRSSLIIISKTVRGFIHACLSLKANEGGLDCRQLVSEGDKNH